MSQDPSPRFSGVVEYLVERDAQGPIQVAITPYCALYVLDRASKDFASWLAIVKKSRDEHLPIVFTYDMASLRFTSLEFGEE